MRELSTSTYGWISRTLRGGSYLATLLLLAGLVWLLAEPDRPLQIGGPLPLGALTGALAQGSPYALMQMGVLLLLLTPLLRITAAGICFWAAGERRYTWVSLAVLGIILLSLLLARTG
jgi:uncharacterized membrane protein